MLKNKLFAGSIFALIVSAHQVANASNLAELLNVAKQRTVGRVEESTSEGDCTLGAKTIPNYITPPVPQSISQNESDDARLLREIIFAGINVLRDVLANTLTEIVQTSEERQLSQSEQWHRYLQNLSQQHQREDAIAQRQMERRQDEERALQQFFIQQEKLAKSKIENLIAAQKKVTIAAAA